MFVIDPKGENAKITARQRRAFGPVFILDPFEVSGQAGAAFNPLALMSAESLDLAEDAATLADALVLDSGDAKDSHWNDEAKALISGIIMYVAASEKPEARNLDRVRQYLTLPPETFKEFLQEMAGSTAAHGLIARTGGRFLGKTGVEFAGVDLDGATPYPVSGLAPHRPRPVALGFFLRRSRRRRRLGLCRAAARSARNL